jgi:rare lipoprotein A
MRVRNILLVCFLACPPAMPGEPSHACASERQSLAAPSPKKVDRSGTVRKGRASYYARRFAGKTMADGTPMDPESNNAASRSLPLGTEARVTNLENGKSARVEITDRGPYVKGRIIDLSSSTATQLDLKKEGTAPVAVAPIAVPQPDGTVKAGQGAGEGGRTGGR